MARAEKRIMPEASIDCFFSLAKTHIVCQDYAAVGAEPLPHLVVCDGCSSSPDTDIGARLIAKSAQKALRHALGAENAALPSYQAFGAATLANAVTAADCLALPRSALDATLVVAVLRQEIITVFMYGDGYLAAVTPSGDIERVGVAFAGNMPYYLNYWSDEPRKSLYAPQPEDGRQAITMTTNRTRDVLPHDAPLKWTFPADQYRLIALLSDGVSAFCQQETNQPLPVEYVLRDLLAYKTTTGEFVKRRAKRLLKEYEKQGIFPADDVAVAAIIL